MEGGPAQGAGDAIQLSGKIKIYECPIFALVAGAS